ncbi:MAG: HEPN domain-containing protein [archaeon GB-1867-035]|nr:HEPN domain-containing protein [Candidatus Culexmicrobium profundum]
MSRGLNIADDFLLFAIEIKDQLEARQTGKYKVTLTQGVLRTCISRAYYAAFLYARRVTNLERYRRPIGIKRVSIHNTVIDRLKEMGIPVADMLYNLKKARGKADYNIYSTITPNKVIWAVKVAQQIIDFLKRAFPNKFQ